MNSSVIYIYTETVCQVQSTCINGTTDDMNELELVDPSKPNTLYIYAPILPYFYLGAILLVYITA